MLYSWTNPFLHQQQPSRESIFCDKMNGWWAKRALIMLKFLLKIRQRRLCHVRAKRKRRREERVFTTASASDCRTCSSQPTEAASGKRRSNRALADGFRLVENTLNGFPHATFLRRNHVLRRTNLAEISDFPYLCSVFHTSMGRLYWFYSTKTINTPQSIRK